MQPWTAQGGVGNRAAGRGRRAAAITLLTLAALCLLFGAQWSGFQRAFAPRLAAANAAYLDLVTEKAESRVYRRLESGLGRLEALAAARGAGGAAATAWLEFDAGFDLAPGDASERLRAELARQRERLPAAGRLIEELEVALDELLLIHADPYSELLTDLERPPWYFLPAAWWARERYTRTLTLNRAFYLARTGELGTARVLLSGLQAEEEAHLAGLVHYTLGRLEIEVMRARPEAGLRSSALEYLQQSLQADPEARLPRQVLAHLLATRPPGDVLELESRNRSSETSPGEGAATIPDFRKF